MGLYYVNDNAQPTGEHEVHKDGCTFFPKEHTYLGDFTTCREAVTKARTIYTNVDGCYTCARECHNR